MRVLLTLLFAAGLIAFTGCGKDKPEIGGRTVEGKDVVEAGDAGEEQKVTVNPIDPKEKK